jgi:survival-of-motor-neuron-related-splicing factor 30
MSQRSELERQLKEQEDQLNQLLQALELQPDNADFQNLATNLRHAIKMTRDAIAAQPEDGPAELHLEEGGKCQAYFASLRKYVNAEIVEETEPGKCVVKYIGYAHDEEVEVATLRAYKPADLSNVKEGSKVKAIYSEDSKFYDATVDRVQADGRYAVTFVGYGNSEVVDAEALEPVEEKIWIDKKTAFNKKGDKGLDALSYEEQVAALQPLPTDSEDVKGMKKRKLHALKMKHRDKELEEERKYKQNNWLNYKAKVSKSSKLSKGHTKSSIFKSPDTLTGKVGVTGSGKAMTTYQGQNTRKTIDGALPAVPHAW